MVSLAYLASSENEKSNKSEAFIYFVLTILFQPFIIVALGRTIGYIVDLIVSIGVIVSLLRANREYSRNYYLIQLFMAFF